MAGSAGKMAADQVSAQGAVLPLHQKLLLWQVVITKDKDNMLHPTGKSEHYT
jgi:hypothetical protein